MRQFIIHWPNQKKSDLHSEQGEQEKNKIVQSIKLKPIIVIPLSAHLHGHR